MHTAPLGTTVTPITRVGLGARAVGDGVWDSASGPQSRADRVAASHHAVAAGVARESGAVVDLITAGKPG